MQNSNDDKLKLGQFKTTMIVDNIKNIVLINPLSQNELAEDWQLVLPTTKKTRAKYHFNVYLAQLPQHLWHHLMQDSNEYYRLIKDNIYTYSVKVSETDDYLCRLYELLNTVDYRVHIEEINNLYSNLYKENVRGWIMIKAKNLLF
jgi:hypothetical protein